MRNFEIVVLAAKYLSQAFEILKVENPIKAMVFLGAVTEHSRYSLVLTYNVYISPLSLF